MRRQEIGKFLDTTARKEVSVGRISIDSVAVEGNTLQLFANMNCAYIPFREDNVAEIYQGVSALLPAEFTKYKLQIRTNKRSIEELVPQVLRSKKDKKTKTFNPVASKPLVTDISAPYTPTNGLQNRHIALWQSHGWYYEPKLDRWEWQRARIFQTVEDLYTQSYVLPFLVPMLENAGANVLLPREPPNGFPKSLRPDNTPYTSLTKPCQTARTMPFTPSITKAAPRSSR